MEFSRDNCWIQPAPGDDETTASWDLIRADPTRPTSFACVSHEPFGIRTHYYGGRTIPCLRSGCLACKDEQTSRWHGYVAALRQGDKRRCLVEYPAAAAVAIRQAWEEHGTLHQLLFTLSRTKNRANAKVRIVTSGISRSHIEMPDPPDVFEVLAKIWGMKRTINAAFAEFADYALNEKERIEAAAAINGKSHDDDWLHSDAQRSRKNDRMPG